MVMNFSQKNVKIWTTEIVIDDHNNFEFGHVKVMEFCFQDFVGTLSIPGPYLVSTLAASGSYPKHSSSTWSVEISITLCHSAA